MSGPIERKDEKREMERGIRVLAPVENRENNLILEKKGGSRLEKAETTSVYRGGRTKKNNPY